MLNKRTLVVQKTGWGKSLVYFVCTKILREKGNGITFIISPLLVLMDNQAEAAEKLGLKCTVLNSKTKDRELVIEKICCNKIDIVLTTPETLFKEDIQDLLSSISIGLFVIDEAHCISEWGHDFRLEYGNLYKVLNKIPSYIPILATTATANNWVINDLKQQLGNDVFISRGPLMRKSLSIQILNLPNKAERYAWILENINKLPGSGIIYCLTQRDCVYLADFLCKNGISAMAYHSGLENDQTELAEELFKKNQIKALVATVKLGMGYDKGDIAFVIHYQQPAGIVSYYQQIGRAGRNIDRAYSFLMCGDEDDTIHEYFIDSAFPTEKESFQVYYCIQSCSEKGMSINDIMCNVNINKGRCEKALMFLKNEGFIVKDKSKYYPTLKEFVYNKVAYKHIATVRYRERELMKELIKTDICYSRFIVNKLDDPTDENCGICSNCLGYDEFLSCPSDRNIEIALDYIERLIMPIEPRKKWPNKTFTGNTKIEYLNEQGICLSKYGDPGYGMLVKIGKYSTPPYFHDELVERAAKVLMPIIAENKIEVITCIPSQKNNLVADFTEKLAKKCRVKFKQFLLKEDLIQQKKNNNSNFQCRNAFNSFSVLKNINNLPESIILVDDIVDSRWTLTVCGYKLLEAGCNKVIPFALADSSDNKENQ